MHEFTFNDMNIIIRRDSFDNWTKVNPILKNRELVAAYTDNITLFYIGDGKTEFKKLVKATAIEDLLPYFCTFVEHNNLTRKVTVKLDMRNIHEEK